MYGRYMKICTDLGKTSKSGVYQFFFFGRIPINLRTTIINCSSIRLFVSYLLGDHTFSDRRIQRPLNFSSDGAALFFFFLQSLLPTDQGLLELGDDVEVGQPKLFRLTDPTSSQRTVCSSMAYRSIHILLLLCQGDLPEINRNAL